MSEHIDLGPIAESIRQAIKLVLREANNNNSTVSARYWVSESMGDGPADRITVEFRCEPKRPEFRAP